MAGERRFVWPRDAWREGLTAIDDALVWVVRDARGALRVERVVSRACAHAAGRLTPSCGALARCPLHGWEVDVASGRYLHVPHVVTPLPWVETPAGVEITVARHVRAVELHAAPAPIDRSPVQVRYLAHACVAVEHRGFRLVVDPWLTGPCFLGGWWLAHAPPADARALLEGADAVYISHNHPDHLHPETLAWVPRDTPILAPAFASGSVVRALRAMGFTRVHALQEDILYRIGEGVHVASSFAGDGRDDSGLFIDADGARVLLTVDANRLGGMALPQDVDLLLTSFAGGASGFPLCFDCVPDAQVDAVVARTRASARAAAAAYVEACGARAWMPYAGFFVEAAPRDRALGARNVKNRVEDVAAAVHAVAPGTEVVDPTVTPDVRLDHDGDRWRVAAGGAAPQRAAASVEAWQARERARVGDLDGPALSGILERSGFRDDLVVLILATDDDFAPLPVPGWRFDARDGSVRRAPANELQAELDGAKARRDATPRRLLLRARVDALASLVRDDRPWEELTIGFQCRVDRHPDVYNVAFWNHFTNVRRAGAATGDEHG